MKLSEGLFSFMLKFLKRQFTAVRNKVGLLLLPPAPAALPGLAVLWPTVKGLKTRVDWREIGGAPLLGVNGVVVIGHGRSDARAIQTMIQMAEKSARQELVQAIRAEFAAQETVAG